MKILITVFSRDMFGKEFQRLSREEFDSLSRGATTLSRDGRGVKVLETARGEVIKFFRLRRRFSSARLYPYSKRFLRNAFRLKQRGIRTVDLLGHYRSHNGTDDAVVYRKLPGEALRSFLNVGCKPEVAHGTLHDFADFLAELHRKGVLFRSIHFGNVVRLPDGCFAVIDIADLSFRRKGSLTPRQRVRNFIHMTRYEVDRQALLQSGLAAFLQRYLDASGMSPSDKESFHKILSSRMKRIDPAFTDELLPGGV